MNWRPPLGIASVVSLTLPLVALIVASVAVVAQLVVGAPVTVRSFALVLVALLGLGLAGVLGYWLWGLLTLRYSLDRNSLRVHWAGTTHVVPLPNIKDVVDGERVTTTPHIRGVRWPGYTVGHAYLSGFGPTRFFLTRPIDEGVIIVTASQNYALTPSNPRAFVDELAARQRLGPSEFVPQAVRTAAWLALPIWRDRLALRLAGAAVMVCLALFAWVTWRYPALPAELALRGPEFPPSSRTMALLLPGIGGLALAVNSALAVLFHARERVAAYLALGGALAAQVLAWLAMVRAL